MSEGIKIKTFNHYNDEIINEFLKQTKGKIVNYNPIVIEYSEKNNEFVDPFLGYNAYLYKCVIKFTPLSNIDRECYKFIDNSKIQIYNIDTVLFNKRNSFMRFMYEGKIILDSFNCENYFQVQLEQKYIDGNFKTPIDTRDFQGDGYSSIDYNFSMYQDSAWGEHFYFEGYLKALKCEQVNFK